MEFNQFMQQAGNLVFSVLIGAAVWYYYQSRAVQPSERYSTFWPRFWAPRIDAVVIWPFVGLLPFLLSYFMPSGGFPLGIFAAFVGFAYSIYFHGKYGGTIGKLRCGIRVRDSKTEGLIGFSQAFKRDSVPLVLVVCIYVYGSYLNNRGGASGSLALSYIPAVFSLWFLAEILTMLTNEKRRAIHDFIAGTVVVRPSNDSVEVIPSQSVDTAPSSAPH